MTDLEVTWIIKACYHGNLTCTVSTHYEPGVVVPRACVAKVEFLSLPGMFSGLL